MPSAMGGSGIRMVSQRGIWTTWVGVLYAYDFLPMDGAPNSHVVLRPGDFLICYPEDGHRTAVAVNEPEKIKKAIFKVRIDH